MEKNNDTYRHWYEKNLDVYLQYDLSVSLVTLYSKLFHGTLGLVVEQPLEIAMTSNYHLENPPRNSKLPNLTIDEPFKLGWCSQLSPKYHIKI